MSRFNYAILQPGSIKAKPNGRLIPFAEHRSTSVVLWPEGHSPSIENTILTDPCLTAEGYQHSMEVLSELGVTFAEIGYVFITHQHNDHIIRFPKGILKPAFRRFNPSDDIWSSEIRTSFYPGHSADLKSLIFHSSSGDTMCIAGDAILNEEWLRAWQYFWPNRYSQAEIIQTWKSVAAIVASSDVIIPGHGAPISVSVALIKELLSGFPAAQHSDRCEEVAQVLKNRLAELV
ncbi:MAG: hypothetical protein HQ553_14525 [Chloroflexi bacterium]|nr:hypothetical protein [Chloroflexota bacterium]